MRNYLLMMMLTLNVSHPIELKDDFDNLIVLEKPAQRVVALAPHIVELVYAVGGGDSLVGAVSYSNYPEEAKQVPRVGNYKNFSYEAILKMQPDLVLAWQSGNGEAKVKQIEDLGLTVYRTDPRTLDAVAKSLRDIGMLLGEKEHGKAAKDFEEKLRYLQQQYSHKKPISVFYQIWNQPLQTINGKHLISDVIRLCGGYNVFANEFALAPILSVESILRANPQVISTSGVGPEWFDEWLAWPMLQAVNNRQLYFVPADLLQRHTSRVLEGAEILCQQIDMAREVY